MSAAIDPLMRKEEAGFQKRRSCGGHIFTLRQTMEQCQEWNIPVYKKFVDFEKAFDSIHIHSVWCIIRHYGIPPKRADPIMIGGHIPYILHVTMSCKMHILLKDNKVI